MPIISPQSSWQTETYTGFGGANILGIIPGKHWNTTLDRPIVIGAHWDTVTTSPGFDDNGSGMAALLEAATVLASASCHQNEYTIIFVAFDAEESGKLIYMKKGF